MNVIVELPLSLLNKNGGKLSLLLFSAACFGAFLKFVFAYFFRLRVCFEKPNF